MAGEERPNPLSREEVVSEAAERYGHLSRGEFVWVIVGPEGGFDGDSPGPTNDIARMMMRTMMDPRLDELDDRATRATMYELYKRLGEAWSFGEEVR